MIFNISKCLSIKVSQLVLCTIILFNTGCGPSKNVTTKNNTSQKQPPNLRTFKNYSTIFQTISTRSWIKLSWQQDQLPEGSDYFELDWTDKTSHETRSQVVSAKSHGFYIHPVQPGRHYALSIKAKTNNNQVEKILFTKNVYTDTSWQLMPGEAKLLDIPSSAAVPKGMVLFFHDEFNDSLLNYNKWFDTYYSTLDFDNKMQWQAFQHNKLPKAAYKLNGNYLDLIVNDTLPKVAFFKDGKKISSIQTYDWVTNTNRLPNGRGGYYEVRVRRNYTGHPSGLNTAFWFDSPGPDLRYYYQKGTTISGVAGIRPKGQLFEIDMFENMNAQFVMHGHVDSNGRFVHNLATDIAKGYEHRGNWVIHGLLWTPNAIKHYINGKLMHSYDDPHQIYSPDHFMNVLLGAYGKGGSVSLQVDYIRAYHWPINKANELPNSGFELNDNMLPWQGTAKLSKAVKLFGKASAKLNPGDCLYQYVYVSSGARYELQFSVLGAGNLSGQVNHVAAVTGQTTTAAKENYYLDGKNIKRNKLCFTTLEAPKGHTKTIKVAFQNRGNTTLYLDGFILRKL
ncbi:hypothetical protein GCM10027566_05290 [Arachidicoccus ginsenosidivorans]